jgi:polysaccharide biosynthesis/export protein
MLSIVSLPCFRPWAWLPVSLTLVAIGSGFQTPGWAVSMDQVVPRVSPSPSSLTPAQPLPSLPLEPNLYPLRDYRLTVGDIVYVTVVNVPDYSGTFQVLPDGSLNLPVLGRVYAWGQTLAELEQGIATAYAEAQILVEPVITVSLSQLSPLRVVVVGEVSQPGVYTLAPDQGRLPTVAIALDAAGGITQHTDLRSIEVRRISPDNQREERITVSLWQLLTEGDRSQDVALRDGDTIVVPEATGIPIATARELANSTFSAGTIRINVVGEITQPGVIEVPADTSVSEALLLAGSFTNRSRRVDVQLLRLNPDGTVTQRSLPVDFASAINDETNPLLQDRDVILIGRNWSASVGDTLGTVLQPLSGAFSLINLFLPFLLLN